MSLKEIKDVSYFKLNNEINRPVDGQIPLNKDKEALAAFFKENVEPNTRKFSSAEEKINFLMKKILLKLNSSKNIQWTLLKNYMLS